MRNKFSLVLALILVLLPVQALAQVSQFNVFSRVLEHHPNKKAVYYPNKIKKGTKTEIKTKESSSSVTLTPQKISIRNDNKEKVYNFSDNTITLIDHTKREFITTSLYAVPAFKDYERKNREKLAQFALKKGFTTLQTDPFEMETIFSDNPNTLTAQKISKKENNGLHKFIYKREEVAAYSLSTFFIQDALKDSYKKYLIYEHSIHPKITEDLSKNKTFFHSLSYRNKQEVPFMTESSFSTSIFKNLASSPITVPTNYQRHYAPDKKLSQLIKLSITTEEKTVDHYLSEMKALLAQKHYLDASLVFYECTNHTGTKGIAKLKGTIQRIFSEAPPESHVQEVSNAIRQQPKSKEQLQKVIETLDKAHRQNTSHSYILNVYLANDLAMAGENEIAKELIFEALEKNPFLTGAYKDLGDKYFTEFDMVNAWASWDQMRRINPEHPLNSFLNQLEHQIRQNHPVYFQEPSLSHTIFSL